MSYVVIECGSSARGDSNLHSDVDIVCLWAGEPPDFENLRLAYGNVMFYSMTTVERMKSKGSLFLVHLDIDGKYKEGDRTLLAGLRGFRPAQSDLHTSYSQAARFVQSIGWYPNTTLGLFWLMDCLYVSLRNCIYCINAMQGIYKFGYVDALHAFGITETEMQVLLALREGKYAFRQRAIDSHRGPSIDDIQAACERITNSAVTFRHDGVTDWNRDWRYDYWDERIIERAILNSELDDPEFIEKLKNVNYNRLGLKLEVRAIVSQHAGPSVVT